MQGGRDIVNLKNYFFEIFFLKNNIFVENSVRFYEIRCILSASETLNK